MASNRSGLSTDVCNTPLVDTHIPPLEWLIGPEPFAAALRMAFGRLASTDLRKAQTIISTAARRCQEATGGS
jgi:hypothetical protein